MGYQRHQPSRREVLELAGRQHGVVSREQLLDLGLSSQAIKHRIARGRLHPVLRGVYAVGRPEVSKHARWMAAVLRCGPDAVLSHETAAGLWEMAPERRGWIELSVPPSTTRRIPGLIAHRRLLSTKEVTARHGIPVTTPLCTLIDIASRLPRGALEAAINEADKRGLTDPERLRAALAPSPGRPGVLALRETLDRRTFTLTDSELERQFMSIVRQANLPMPVTGRYINGFKVDFHWPEIGLVVETDGLRYHRTPAQQARDRLRDQAHIAAGLTCLRFTHAQVRFEPDRVRSTLTAVLRRARRTQSIVRSAVSRADRPRWVRS
jgi:very-short-patch-repair endonuclease